MVGVINYGLGNLTSVKNALDFIGAENKIITAPGEIKGCSKILLPGVGAFGKAIENLNSTGFFEAIKEAAEVHKKPLLGICLGAQLLLESSEEKGSYEGLGLVKGKVLSLARHVNHSPVPHVGWNDVTASADSLILKNKLASFYFVHSFYCNVEDPAQVTGRTSYEFEFPVVFEKDNIFGCQFHPEKSQLAGLNLLKEFCSL